MTCSDCCGTTRPPPAPQTSWMNFPLGQNVATTFTPDWNWNHVCNLAFPIALLYVLLKLIYVLGKARCQAHRHQSSSAGASFRSSANPSLCRQQLLSMSGFSWWLPCWQCAYMIPAQPSSMQIATHMLCSDCSATIQPIWLWSQCRTSATYIYRHSIIYIYIYIYI